MYFADLLSLKYWFMLRPGDIENKAILIALYAIIGLTFLAGLIGYFGRKYVRNHYKLLSGLNKKITTIGLTMGALGLLYLFCVEQRAYFLSARFWFLIWILGLITWVVFLVRYYKVKLPREQKSISDQMTFEKYLPKPGSGKK